MKKRVLIRKIHPDAVIPKYAKEGDAGFDFVAAESAVIAPGETVKVRTGLAFAVPYGYEIQVRPRSGISANTTLRVANSPGTIDSGFRGEVKILLTNQMPEAEQLTMDMFLADGESAEFTEPSESGTYFIQKGDRIAQGVLAPVIRAIFEETEELDETERGATGFGDSGVRR